jgi:hypothetical protein
MYSELTVWEFSSLACSSTPLVVIRHHLVKARQILLVGQRNYPRATIDLIYVSRRTWDLHLVFHGSFTNLSVLDPDKLP